MELMNKLRHLLDRPRRAPEAAGPAAPRTPAHADGVLRPDNPVGDHQEGQKHGEDEPGARRRGNRH